MNLPNKLTTARFFVLPLFMIFTYTDNVYTRFLALIIFVVAGVTDLYDGYLARKYNLITPLGVFLDPLADKLIITAALISFVELDETHVPAWMVVLIVGREFLITGLRALAASQGHIVGADEGGKFKTSVQTTAIISTLIALIAASGLERFAGTDFAALQERAGWRAEAAKLMAWTPYWMIFIATLASLATGLSYLRKHLALFKKDL